VAIDATLVRNRIPNKVSALETSKGRGEVYSGKVPVKGGVILLTTDLILSAEEVILLYSLRFKIELAFKQAVHPAGSFSCHFWMVEMKPVKRRNGNQYLHRTSERYCNQVARKLRTYHVFVEAGMIAHGML
jgi:hypothetical protein